MAHEHAALTATPAATAQAAEESRRASERLGWPRVEQGPGGVWRPWFRTDEERRSYESRGPRSEQNDWAAEAAARERRLNAIGGDLRDRGHSTRPGRPETAEARERYLATIRAADLFPQLRDAGHTAGDAAVLALAVAMVSKPQEPGDRRAFERTLGRVGL